MQETFRRRSPPTEGADNEQIEFRRYFRKKQIPRFPRDDNKWTFWAACQGFSFAELLQLKMAHDDVHPFPAAQAFGQLLRKIDRAMLTAGAAEGHHQVLEAALLIIVHAGIHQRDDAREKLVNAFLLVQIVDDRSVFARQGLEAIFAPGIRKAADIENESPAVPGIILRQAPVK